MKKILIFLQISILLVSCKTNESDTQADTSEENMQAVLYQEVISGHDEVMPKLQDISSLMERLEAKIGEMEQNSGGEEELNQLRNQMQMLGDADESMMQWMRNFETKYEGWEEDKIIKYLEEEKQKITNVAVEVNTAIEGARELLN
jgi:hypothetical protein